MTFESRKRISLVVGRFAASTGLRSRDLQRLLQQSHDVESGLVNKTA